MASSISAGYSTLFEGWRHAGVSKRTASRLLLQPIELTGLRLWRGQIANLPGGLARLRANSG
jgi:hypothetical protein